ncbi:Tudor/PWWP/MBT [Trametes cingulata]|nr:Tudor/PWWP/MBT [Trametes cingulata]
MSKKGAKTQNKEQSYEVRDIVLAKVRGFPPWPGMIVDPDTVPEAVAKERPNAKSKKGNWYCVRFFPAGDYAWIVPKDISRLQQHEIQAYISEPYKRSGELLKGYRIALDPKAWEEEREAAAVEAQEEEDNAEVDQLESDGEEEADDDEEDKKKKTKKRKRDSEAAPAKTKAKAKKDSAEPAKKRAASAPKGKKGPKSKAMVESEDEGGAEDGEREGSGPSKRSSPPPAKKAKRDKDEDGDSPLMNDPEALKVREWRHKLQKAFLNTKATPKEEDMPGLDTLFSTVENYDNMTIEYLTFSKIGKVMRHIHALSDDKVPRDDEFKFRERAKVLVDKWHDILKANGAPESKPAANGTRKAADAEDAAVSSPNGKAEENGTEAKQNGTAMEVDADAKGEAEPAAESTADAETKPAEEDAPANGAADESVLADVTMSEAAA